MYIEMTDGVRIFIERKGEGQACIFVHGGPGSWGYDFQEYGSDCLKESLEVINYDQRGCGRSYGDGESDYSINRMVEDIEEIRISLGLEKIVVMAHSFGGIIAVNYAKKYKENIKALILLNCTLYMKDSFKSQIEYGLNLLGENNDYKYDDNTEFLAKWNKVISALLQKDLFYKLQYQNHDNFDKVNSFFSIVDNFNHSMGSQAFSNEEYNKCYYQLSKEIDSKTLVITGSEDYAIGCEHYKNFLFPNATYKVLEGKHLLYIENMEDFKAEVLNFIEKL